MNKVPILVINLKKDVDKRNHIHELCKKYSLECQFIDAVYGKDLSDDYIAQVYSKKKAIYEFGRELTKGEIGCALSHLSIYKEIIDKNIEVAIVIEDDINIEDGFLNILSSLNNLPKNWECILLGHYRFSYRKLLTASSYWKRTRINKQYEIVRLAEHAYGTHGYMVNKKGAEKFIQEMTKLSKPVDLYTGDDTISNLFAVTPPCVTLHPIHSLDSNIHNDREQTNSEDQYLAKNNSKLKFLLKKIRLFNVSKRVYDFVSLLPIIFRYQVMKMRWPKNYK